jgi:hypothetical protein
MTDEWRQRPLHLVGYIFIVAMVLTGSIFILLGYKQNELTLAGFALIIISDVDIAVKEDDFNLAEMSLMNKGCHQVYTSFAWSGVASI